VERVEEYLEAIYDIQTKEQRIVKTNDLAKKMGVKPSSVTEMLTKLSEMGYIDYKPYYGAFLTEKGKEVAKRIKRYHWIFEAFFVNFLGVDKEEAHKLSCELEHHVNDEVANRICRLIASEDCTICEDCDLKISRLSTAPPGKYEVLFSPTALSKMGLVPGNIISVKKGEGIIEFEGEEYLISEKLTSNVVLEKKD